MKRKLVRGRPAQVYLDPRGFCTAQLLDTPEVPAQYVECDAELPRGWHMRPGALNKIEKIALGRLAEALERHLAAKRRRPRW